MYGVCIGKARADPIATKGKTHMNVITYGEHTIDPTKLPVESINALLRRGVSHFLGNEQASKLTAWVESVTKDGGAVPDDSAKAAKKTELIKAAIEALASGTVGTRVSGPRVEPIEATRNAIAKKEVLDILRAANIKVPKGEEAVRFADGTQKTLAQMVATRLEKFGDRIEKEAQKKLADDARRVKAAQATTAAAESKTADALGL